MSRVKIGSDGVSGFILMVEPLGIDYRLEAGEFMSFEFSVSDPDGMEIIYWEGGVSVWLYGDVIVFDRNEVEIDRLFS